MGRVVDPETGLQYLRARYYDPATGQFLSRDPLDALTRSAYGYVDNNPLNATDPAGLAGWDPSGHHLPGQGDAVPGGRYFQPGKRDHGQPKWDNEQKGWKDANGDVWRWDPVKGEWDVQHDGGSGHTNVDPTDGHITHGGDQFGHDKNKKKCDDEEDGDAGADDE